MTNLVTSVVSTNYSPKGNCMALPKVNSRDPSQDTEASNSNIRDNMFRNAF